LPPLRDCVTVAPALGKCEPRLVAMVMTMRRALEKARLIDPPSGEPSLCSRPEPAAREAGATLAADGQEGPARLATGILRRRRAGRRVGRARARAVRGAGLRPQADRPQPARRTGA